MVMKTICVNVILKMYNVQLYKLFQFASPMTKSIYSEYVNNYEAASEIIREAENSKPPLKDFLMVCLPWLHLGSK